MLDGEEAVTLDEDLVDVELELGVGLITVVLCEDPVDVVGIEGVIPSPGVDCDGCQETGVEEKPGDDPEDTDGVDIELEDTDEPFVVAEDTLGVVMGEIVAEMKNAMIASFFFGVMRSSSYAVHQTFVVFATHSSRF